MSFEDEDTFEEINERLDKLIEDRVAAERERCAKIACSFILAEGGLEVYELMPSRVTPRAEVWDEACRQIAAKIRSGE